MAEDEQEQEQGNLELDPALARAPTYRMGGEESRGGGEARKGSRGELEKVLEPHDDGREEKVEHWEGHPEDGGGLLTRKVPRLSLFCRKTIRSSSIDAADECDGHQGLSRAPEHPTYSSYDAKIIQDHK